MPILLAQAGGALASDLDFSYWGLFLKTIVATVFIIALAFLALRYLVPRLHGLRRSRDSRVKVLEYQPLEPRKGIYVVEISGKKMALGVSENFVGKVCDVE